MSGASSAVMQSFILYDSGVVPGGAAIDSGIIDFTPYTTSVSFYMVNHHSADRTLTPYLVRDDGIETSQVTSTATARTVSNSTLNAGITGYSRVRLVLAALGSSDARLVVKVYPR